jgi:hypothetical protein
MRQLHLNKIKLFSSILEISKNEYVRVTVLLTILLMVFFYNVVFFNATLMTSPITPGTMPTGSYGYVPKVILPIVIDPGASSWQYEPSFALASNIYKSGDMPIWNPYIALGTPFAADMQSSVFFPLNFIVYFTPEPYFWSALDFILIIRLFIAGFFTYCFMRAIEVNRFGSFASAVAFMFNGYFILYINMSHLNVEILIPILLFTFEKLVGTQNVKYIIIAGIAVTLSILGGMPESTLFALFLATIYYFYRVYFKIRKEKIFTIKKYTLSILSVFFLGGLLSSILTFPFIEYLIRSWNAHPQIVGLSHNPFLYDTISIIVPYFFGWIWMNWNGMSQYSILPYIGILTFLLALFTFSKKNENTQLSLFFIGFAVFFLLKTYGFSIVNWIGYLPLFNVSIFSKYLFPEFAFSLAVLAGIGIHNVYNNKVNFTKSVILSSVIVLVLGIFLFFNMDPLIINKNKWSLYLFNPVTWVFAMIGFAVFVILIVNILFLVQRRKIINCKQLVLFLILLLIFELFVYVPHFRPQRYDPFTPAPYTQFLKNNTEEFRVVGLNSLLYPNTASGYGIYDIRELNGIYLSSYMSFIKKNIDPTVYDRFTGKQINLGYKNGKFLDLLGVKYILSLYDLQSGQDTGLIDNILTTGKIISENKQFVSKSQFDGKAVLFEHSPSRINYQVLIPNDSVFLNFSIGMDPAVWSPSKGEGVEFEIYINETGKEEKIFSKYIDPKNNPEDRKWYYSDINLTKYRGKKINLSFITLPGPSGSNAFDWAGWGDIHFKSKESEEKMDKFNKRFELVYDKEIKIYKNTEVFPRAFVVHNAEVIKNEQEILDKLDSSDFDLRNSIIIEKDATIGFKNEKMIDNSTVNITQYEFNSISINANLENDGFLVLSDSYYPGWKAYVDNKETEIYKADYLLKAVYLSRGTHVVEFKYEPLSFKIGFFLSVVTFIFILGYFILSYIRKINR